MCTVTFIPRGGGFYLAMNRDERITRPLASPPSVFGDRVASVYPLDSEGGTWVAANSMGIAFTLLNWNDARVLGAKSRTRGCVIPALVTADCSQAVESELRQLDLNGILPFRLVVVFPAEQSVFEWRWNQTSIERSVFPWTPRQWCSSSLSDAEAASARRRIFEQKMEEQPAASVTWLRQLHSSHDERHPLFSHCVHREEVETVSYTELVCSCQRIECNYFAGSPCKADPIWQSVSLPVRAQPA